jgi:hypothetical protein
MELLARNGRAARPISIRKIPQTPGEQSMLEIDRRRLLMGTASLPLLALLANVSATGVARADDTAGAS